MTANSTIVFERDYGIRQLATPQGELITSVSKSSWESFVTTLGGLAQQNVGTFITTPELITSTDVALPELSNNKGIIEDRVAEAKALSRRFPDTTLLLGSVVFDQAIEKPGNAVLFLQDGSEIGRSYKQNPIGKVEREFLDTTKQGDVTKPAPNILNIICSDLVSPPLIDDEVNTLLVSACWGTPAGYPGVLASPDHRHVEFIKYLSNDLFEQHHKLNTIVMTDRAPEANSSAGPFNFIATR